MIDPSKETIIPLREAAAVVPLRRRGKPISLATLYRWAGNGVRGVRLETIQIGPVRCTSKEALARFYVALTAAAEPQAEKTGAARRRRTDAQMEAAGL